jgi:hypothetical protein
LRARAAVAAVAAAAAAGRRRRFAHQVFLAPPREVSHVFSISQMQANSSRRSHGAKLPNKKTQTHFFVEKARPTRLAALHSHWEGLYFQTKHSSQVLHCV